MDLKKPVNWIKVISLIVLLVIETVLTFVGYGKNWNQEVMTALLVFDVITLFDTLMSIINKFDNEHKDMQKRMVEEHTKIIGAIELYKDIEELSYISCFEGTYIQSQIVSGTEIWIISNCIDEPETVLHQIYKNLVEGVTYYYVIPNDSACETDLKNTANRLSELKKKNRCNVDISIKYIQDDLFDFLPINLVDVLFYCNPNSPDYTNNMRVFYAFQNDMKSGLFYKPALLDNSQKRLMFKKMGVWKKRRWKKLTI